MVTEQWIASHRERLLKNKQVALRMLHNIEGALSLLETMTQELVTGPVPETKDTP